MKSIQVGLIAATLGLIPNNAGNIQNATAQTINAPQTNIPDLISTIKREIIKLNHTFIEHYVAQHFEKGEALGYVALAYSPTIRSTVTLKYYPDFEGVERLTLDFDYSGHGLEVDVTGTGHRFVASRIHTQDGNADIGDLDGIPEVMIFSMGGKSLTFQNYQLEQPENASLLNLYRSVIADLAANNKPPVSIITKPSQ